MKPIIVGITGSIAAYKAAELVRRLRELEYDVHVVMTEHAKAFISPLTLQALSGNPVLSDWNAAETQAGMDHIALARQAQQIICAPASANFIARLACGLADDLLSTLCLASTAPVTIVPAMNQQMWANPATQHNIALLASRGVTLLGPASGSQACGETGLGRMVEVETILSYLQQKNATLEKLQGKKILITAGPTHEALDPVRFIGNYSSGKMGFALAEAAHQAGANVTLISGPVNLTTHTGIKRINVISATDMHAAVMQHISDQDIFISAAAVADYRPQQQEQKIKKSDDTITLTLTRNPDILSAVTQLSVKPFVVGFALETERLMENAKEKLLKKNLDMIVANAVSSTSGFSHDVNEVVLLSRDGHEHVLKVADKKIIARGILESINRLFH